MAAPLAAAFGFIVLATAARASFESTLKEKLKQFFFVGKNSLALFVVVVCESNIAKKKRFKRRKGVLLQRRTFALSCGGERCHGSESHRFPAVSFSPAGFCTFTVDPALTGGLYISNILARHVMISREAKCLDICS